MEENRPIKVRTTGRSKKESYEVIRLKKDGFFPEFVYHVEYEETSKTGGVMSLGERTVRGGIAHTGNGYGMQVFKHTLLEYINNENESWGNVLVAHYINGRPVIKNDELVQLLSKTDLPLKVKKAMGL